MNIRGSFKNVCNIFRGLLGDATEEFIETLDNKGQSTVDNEEVYKMANVLGECNGLKVMVTRLGAIQNVWRAKPLLQVGKCYLYRNI